MWPFGRHDAAAEQREVGELTGWVYARCVAGEASPELTVAERRCVVALGTKLRAAFAALNEGG